MKKTIFAIALVMTMGLCANAQNDGFFRWNDSDNDIYRVGSGDGFTLPTAHGIDTDSSAPLGTGLLILTALGAGYAVARKHHTA